MTDEDHENMGATKSEEEEEDHREDVKKFVEMMQKEEEEREAPNLGLVAHTPRPCRTQKVRKHEG